MVMQVAEVPKGEFLLGHMRPFMRDTLAVLMDGLRQGGLARFWFGPYPVYLISAPELAHDLLVKQPDKINKSAVLVRVLGMALGQGLFTSDGEFWKRQRRLVQPAFHAKRIGAYAAAMADYSEELARAWQTNTVYDIDKEMAVLTMRIIARTVFDSDLLGDGKVIADAVAELLHYIDRNFNDLVPLPDWLPTPQNRRTKYLIDLLNHQMQKYIDARRADGGDHGDLLSMLLLAQDEDDSVMTDKQVRDEAMTFFGAGHETTAGTMTWVWLLLAQHPDVEAKLHAELARVLGGRTPTIDDLPNLPYTEQIIKEALRLYPAAWTVTRTSIAPLTLNGVTLPKQTEIMVNIYGMHRDPQLFPDPERFDPERFTPENEKQIPKYAYLPFGAGPRVCIGNMFAMMEAKVILATMAQRVRLSLVDAPPLPQRQFTLKPKGGLRLRAQVR
jgi:cytochrome P450